jgi:hypothetical protein
MFLGSLNDHVSANYLPWKTERMLLTLRSRPGIEVKEKYDFYHNVVPSHFSLIIITFWPYSMEHGQEN